MNFFVVSIGIAIAVGLAGFALVRKRRRKLSDMQRHHLQLLWSTVCTERDPAKKILEADKVLDALLKALNFTGTLGEKLKKADALLPNKQALWDAHKVRNRIAHEAGFAPSPHETDRAIRAFEIVIRKYVPSLSSVPDTSRSHTL